MLAYLLLATILSVLLLLTRILYIALRKGEKIPQKKSDCIRTLVVLGSGGHTTEILQIVKNLNFESYSPRIYVRAGSDKISESKVREVEAGKQNFEILKISRSREVGQSYVTSVWTTFISFIDSMKIVWDSKPDLILCNGPGTCVPICIAAFSLKIFFLTQTTIIFIESFCRVRTLSLSGKILYRVADHVIVQWPELYKNRDKHVKISSMALITGARIPWNLIFENLHQNIPCEMKNPLIAMCNELRSSLQTNETMTKKQVDDSLLKLEAYLDQTWETLNTGYWKDVPMDYRFCYTLCSLVKCVFLEILSTINEKRDENLRRETFVQIIKQVDRAILLGAPLPNAPTLMTEIASRINDYLATNWSGIKDGKKIPIDDSNISDQLLSGFSSIKSYDKPSMETFYREVFKVKTPALLKNCLNHWRALEAWKDVDYLMKIAGNRTVPIEIGSRYTEEDWSQSLVTFADFVRSHVSKNNEKIGYLAQHQLFEQIPEMRDDFSIPDYCNFTDNEEDPESPDINAWFGPRGTVSPLHFDPKNNLLCQVFGYKRVILYCPEESSNLYSYETRLLSNTAQVDPLNPDFNKWPKFREAKGLVCLLSPGEMLFIPPKWWHHVESLTPSFSISFWWC